MTILYYLTDPEDENEEFLYIDTQEKSPVDLADEVGGVIKGMVPLPDDINYTAWPTDRLMNKEG